MRVSKPTLRKIIDAPALAAELAALRAAGQRVVQCHGCFDIVHPGHIRYLEFARRLGDILVVSLTGDAGVAKGPDRPYIPQELRAESLAALEFVHRVVIDPHPNACELLALIKPDVYVKGREYATAGDPRFARERAVVESYGGRVVFHSGDVVFSSTRLLESIRRDAQLDEYRLRVFCDRSGIDAAVVQETLRAFNGLRALVVGDLILDRYVHCDASSTAEDAPVLSLRKLGEAEYWGGAAAVVLQLQALGAQPRLFSAAGVGDAQALTARLGDLGLAATLLGVRPATVERMTVTADENKLYKLNTGDASPLDSATEAKLGEELRAALHDADLLIWCDHGFGMLGPALVGSVSEYARQRGVTVAGHAPGQWGQLGILRCADLIFATERQLRGAMNDMTSGLPAVVWNLLDRIGGKAAIIGLHKRGLIGFRAASDGVSLPHQDRLMSEFVSTPAAHFADLAGVEEAALSAAAMVLCSGRSLAVATYFAAAVEALAGSRTGIRPPTGDDLQAWFAQRPELRRESQFFPDAATVSDLASLAPPLAVGGPG